MCSKPVCSVSSCTVQAAGAVAAPVKRLALDHDLSKPVPKAVEVAATENELDADLSALYQERAHVGQGSEVR